MWRGHFVNVETELFRHARRDVTLYDVAKLRRDDGGGLGECIYAIFLVGQSLATFYSGFPYIVFISITF